jgi:3alpha(or 20beta)-hydroxysteroid dehydrogenase
MMGRLAGKVAIITGASGGIGCATAIKMHAEGGKLMLAGRDAARLDAARVAVNGGDDVAVCIGDPANEADMVALVAATVERFGGVDIMFVNAGSEGRIAPLTAIGVEEFDLVQAANVRGTWLSIKAAVPAMAARGGGSIICTSSVAGSIGVAGLCDQWPRQSRCVGTCRFGHTCERCCSGANRQCDDGIGGKTGIAR